MDRVLNSNLETETIYEIYRACRLCGAGAGYKMPIVQNVVSLAENGVELSKKIQKCVQIEVHQDDKMPPLICELCVDKVNDFYEFQELCHQTNKRTRLKLGLPLHSPSREKNSDSSNCILGVTEPIYLDDDSDVEPLVKRVTKSNPRESLSEGPPREMRSLKKKHEAKITINDVKKDPTPYVVLTRTSNSIRQNKEKDQPLQEMANKLRSAAKQPKCILKKEIDKDVIKIHDETSLLSKVKRRRRSDEKQAVQFKRVRLSATETGKTSPKPQPSVPNHRLTRDKSKTSQSPPIKLEKASSAPAFMCPVCFQEQRTLTGYNNHMRIHVVSYTSNRLACNPCGEWFLTAEQCSAHHRRHKHRGLPYRCRRCFGDFANMELYNDHIARKQCAPSETVPDVSCEVCWTKFPTENLLKQHNCPRVRGQRGGKCKNCGRTYILMKNLKIHEKVCKAKKISELRIEPGVLETLVPVQIRLVRCDSLLTDGQRRTCNVTSVSHDYGFDKNCVYPYISSVRSLRIKSEPLDNVDCMVNIQEGIKEELYDDDNIIDWDSDNEGGEAQTDSGIARIKRVDTLASLALKAMCSQRCLGKVPKKYRKIKVGRMFDSVGEFGVKNIDKLLEKLEDDNPSDKKLSDADKEDSLPDKSVLLSGDSDYINSIEKSINNESSVEIVENSFIETVDLSLDINSGESDHKGTGEDKSNDNSTKEANDNHLSNERIIDNSDDAEIKDSFNDCNENNVEEKNTMKNDDLIIALKGNADTIDEELKTDEILDELVDQETHHNGVLKENSALNNTTNAATDDNGATVDERISTDVNMARQVGIFDRNDEFVENVANGKVDLDPNVVSDVDEKLTLDDLFMNRDGKSMDLDSISDGEFNFDI